MDQRGQSLIEMIVALGIVLALSAVALPMVGASLEEARLLGAGRVFKGEFQKARSAAVRANAQTAIRFERGGDGRDYYSVYLDGNRNGVLARDIDRGRDSRLSGPLPLDAGAAGVRVGINAGVRALPPERGTLDPADPIRFSANMLSFSPYGTATPGTFYLAGRRLQAAVRVTGGSARVRLMVWRGGEWQER